jgi:outer membrane protein assembly factor BamB
VFVPMVNGRIEGYKLEAGAKQSPWIYRSAGHVLTPLVVTHEAVCWTTNKGYLYVLDPKTLSIRYRLETRGAIHSRPAYWTPNIYACSADGCVYAVNEASGRIVWKYSVGDAIYESPVAINDRVFVVSVLGGMVCLDAKAGEPIWECPQIAQFVSLSPSRVYAIDRIGRMVILDAKTGTRLTSVPLNGVTLKLSNNECDRIYLANDANVVQCLREIDLKSPLAYIPPEPEKVEVQIKKPEKKAKAESADDSAEEPAAGDEDNPAMEAETPDASAEGDESDPFK